jgi:hypothetical protein
MAVRRCNGRVYDDKRGEQGRAIKCGNCPSRLLLVRISKSKNNERCIHTDSAKRVADADERTTGETVDSTGDCGSVGEAQKVRRQFKVAWNIRKVVK